MSIRAESADFRALVKRRGVRTAASVLRQSRSGASVVTIRDSGRRYAMTNDGSVGWHLAHSTAKLRKLAGFVRPDDRVILDVGAHSGLFSAFAKDRAPGADVIAVEADPINEAALRINLDRPGCRFELAAAGSHAGTARFYRNEQSGQASSTLAEAAAVTRGKVVELQVPMIRLDDMNLGPVDVLKMDVQGAERAVLDGAKELLTRVRTVLVEVSFLDPDPVEVLTRLRSEFGSQEVVNPVLMGADLAFTRR